MTITPVGGYVAPGPGSGGNVPTPGYSGTLIDTMKLLMDSIVGVYEQAGVGLPARRYLSFGGTAADCEQLTVQLDQHYKGTPGGDPNATQACNSPRTVALLVQLFRPAAAIGHRGQPPTVEQLNHTAETCLRDAWLLLDASEAFDAAHWSTGVIAEVTAGEASGAFININMSVVTAVG